MIVQIRLTLFSKLMDKSFEEEQKLLATNPKQASIRSRKRGHSTYFWYQYNLFLQNTFTSFVAGTKFLTVINLLLKTAMVNFTFDNHSLKLFSEQKKLYSTDMMAHQMHLSQPWEKSAMKEHYINLAKNLKHG